LTVIVDASVAIKWLIEEDGSEAARKLAAAELMAAPDLLFIECANVLRTKTRFEQLDPQLATLALAALEAMPIRPIGIRPHLAAALAIANELDRSAYDSLYLAVALAERAVLVTADKRFADAVRTRPVYRDAIRRLDD
jgi:predicted nucleic acid-binding protein